MTTMLRINGSAQGELLDQTVMEHWGLELPSSGHDAHFGAQGRGQPGAVLRYSARLGEQMQAQRLLRSNALEAGQVLIDTGRQVAATGERVAATLERVRAARRGFQAPDETVGLLPSVLAHDLKSPIVTLAGYMAYLQKHEHAQLSERGQSFLSTCGDLLRQMQDQINCLTKLAQTKQAPTATGPLQLSTIADDALSRVEQLVTDSDAEVTVGELPSVRGDRAQLTTLFQNLIQNACKYVPPTRAPDIRISAEREGAWIRVRVRDNGIGVPPSMHLDIFRMGVRAHAEAGYEGTGLGLALCARIAQEHGGSIGVVSDPELGDGSTFWVLLKSVVAPCSKDADKLGESAADGV